MTQQGPNPSNAFGQYQFGTSNALASRGVQSPNHEYQLSPFDTLGSSRMAQYQMDCYEGLQEVEEPKPNTGLKLGYKRASTACKQCRHRKIRCIASASDARGRCVNCVRLKKDCSSYLTSQSSADGAAPKRVARTSPSPAESLKVTDLSEPSFDMLRLPEKSNQPFNPPKMWPTASGAPTNPVIPWTDSFSPGSVTTGQPSLNMRSQSLPEWDAPSMSRTLFANTGDFGSTQEVQLPDGLSSQFSTFVPMSRSSTSSVLPSTNPLSQGDTDFLWDSNTYSLPVRPMGGFSGSANVDNMFLGGEGADFDVHASISTNQLFPPGVNYTSQGRSQSLPYTGYTPNRSFHRSIIFDSVCAMEPYLPSEASRFSNLPTLPPLSEVIHHDLLHLRRNSSSPSVAAPRTQPSVRPENICSLPIHAKSTFPERRHDFLTASSHFRPHTSISNPADSDHHWISPVKDEIPHVMAKRSFDVMSARVPPASAYTFLNSDPIPVAQANRSSSHEPMGYRARHHSPETTSFRARFDGECNGEANQTRYKAIVDRYPSHQSLEESLGQIMSLSQRLCEFAEANERIFPARLPKECEVSDMLRNLEIVKQLLQQFKPLLSPLEARSGPRALQHIIDVSDRGTRLQHTSEQAIGPNLAGIHRARTEVKPYVGPVVSLVQGKMPDEAPEVVGQPEAGTLWTSRNETLYAYAERLCSKGC
ncbi:hypothetical protein F53441_4919 [Fusarium austroafricanum]|uniref:Zn(2)-C6 fungal-type domain-containing protein n=1 Tax=Fusarium austroafricanum TaxID=2364996 RepID=A0A8H4KL97_9HYPO|nr:hypothetical protein F53441_4919 [Fusarium austroafricanum]